MYLNSTTQDEISLLIFRVETSSCVLRKHTTKFWLASYAEDVEIGQSMNETVNAAARAVVQRAELHALLESALGSHLADDGRKCICCINVDRSHVAGELVDALVQAGIVVQFSTDDEPLDEERPAEDTDAADEPPYKVVFSNGHIIFGQTEDEIRTAIHEYQSKCHHLLNLNGECRMGCGWTI
jgi:hypothetical protein